MCTKGVAHTGHESSLACTCAVILYAGMGVHVHGWGSVYMPYMTWR